MRLRERTVGYNLRVIYGEDNIGIREVGYADKGAHTIYVDPDELDELIEALEAAKLIHIPRSKLEED